MDLLTLRHPTAPFQSFHSGESGLTLETAFRQAPLSVIGRAPDCVYLGLGHSDLLHGAVAENMRKSLESLVQLILQKTAAKIVLASACEAFFPEETQRASAREYNAALSSLAGERAFFLDLNTQANVFLEKHRKGSGEKRALHLSPLRLTSMGRVFFSHAALEGMPWESWLAR